MPNQIASDRKNIFYVDFSIIHVKNIFSIRGGLVRHDLGSDFFFALALQFPQLGVSFRIRWLLNTLSFGGLGK